MRVGVYWPLGSDSTAPVLCDWGKAVGVGTAGALTRGRPFLAARMGDIDSAVDGMRTCCAATVGGVWPVAWSIGPSVAASVMFFSALGEVQEREVTAWTTLWQFGSSVWGMAVCPRITYSSIAALL